MQPLANSQSKHYEVISGGELDEKSAGKRLKFAKFQAPKGSKESQSNPSLLKRIFSLRAKKTIPAAAVPAALNKAVDFALLPLDVKRIIVSFIDDTNVLKVFRKDKDYALFIYWMVEERIMLETSIPAVILNAMGGTRKIQQLPFISYRRNKIANGLKEVSQWRYVDVKVPPMYQMPHRLFPKTLARGIDQDGLHFFLIPTRTARLEHVLIIQQSSVSSKGGQGWFASGVTEGLNYDINIVNASVLFYSNPKKTEIDHQGISQVQKLLKDKSVDVVYDPMKITFNLRDEAP